MTPIRIVQFSDCHLFAEEEGKLLGLQTAFSLKLVLDLIQHEQKNVAVYLATGDLSQDNSLRSYQRFAELTATLTSPLYCLPGNHDEVTPMHTVLESHERVSPCVVKLGNWRIVMLNSNIEGAVPGRLKEEQLLFLENALTSETNAHILVAVHHNPMPIGSKWLDNQGIQNGEAFLNLIDRHPHVKAIIWGHVHQVHESVRNGVKMLSVPSTCVQFKPNCEDFTVDDAAPGYRWLDLYEDGRIETGVSRVTAVKFEVDYSVKGY